MKKLRVGIMGAGRMGKIRVEAAFQLGVDVKYVVDVAHDRAAAIAMNIPGCEAITGESLPDHEIDALFICSPPASHASLSVEAIRRGIHVFIEKPLSITLTDAATIERAAADSTVVVAVGFMNRYRESVQTVRKILQTEPPIGITCHWVCKEYAVNWWKDASQSGGAFNEQGCHFVDLQRYLGGEIQWVQAVTARHLSGAAGDTFAILLGFVNGATGMMFYSCKGNDKDIGFRIHHTQGPMALLGWDLTLSPAALFDQGHAGESGNAIFMKETAGFLRAALTRERSDVNSDIADAIRTQRVVDTILTSAASGEKVHVDPASKK